MPVGVRTPSFGTVKTWWVPQATVTAYPAITATMLTSSTELSYFELPDSSVKVDADDVITENAIGDVAKTDVPTFGNYSGSLHLFRSYTSSSVLGSDDLLAIFAGRPFGYYVRRTGFPVATVPVATHVVEAYLFQAGSVTVEPPDGGNFKMMVPLLKRGVYSLSIALT